MPPRAQQQNDTLENIKNQLVKIRDSEALQNVEADSDVAKGLEGVFKGTGNVFSDLQVENGVLTSRSAQRAVDEADKNVRSQRGGSSNKQDPMAQLREQNQKLQEAFEREKSTREGLEADASIADQRAENTANEAAAKAASASKGGDESASTTPSTEGEQTAPEAETDAFSNIESDDPIVQAQIQNAREQNQLINQQLDALDNFVDSSEEDTKAMIDSLRSTADRQIQRAKKENDRLAQAAQVSGIVAGRGMYSPEEHEGIISETIQEGLDRIGDIENTRNVAIMEAKKAQREFRYEAFVQMSDMVSALSDAKRQAIVDVNTRLNEIEQQEREKQVFDQEQAERNAFILAPELADATPEQIAQTAAANGIDVGLLQREVQTYKQDQKTLELESEGQRLSNENTRQSILTKKNDRYLASLASDDDDDLDLEAMSENEQEQFEGTYGWQPPFGMSQEAALRVEEAFAGEDPAIRAKRAREIMVGQNKNLVETMGDDISLLAENDENIQEVLDSLADTIGAEEENITQNPRVQAYLSDVAEIAAETGSQPSTRDIVDKVSMLILEDVVANEKEQEEKQEEINRLQSSISNAQSTRAVTLQNDGISLPSFQDDPLKDVRRRATERSNRSTSTSTNSKNNNVRFGI